MENRGEEEMCPAQCTCQSPEQECGRVMLKPEKASCRRLQRAAGWGQGGIKEAQPKPGHTQDRQTVPTNYSIHRKE